MSVILFHRFSYCPKCTRHLNEAKVSYIGTSGISATCSCGWYFGCASRLHSHEIGDGKDYFFCELRKRGESDHRVVCSLCEYAHDADLEMYPEDLEDDGIEPE